jgi:hypothetical protein
MPLAPRQGHDTPSADPHEGKHRKPWVPSEAPKPRPEHTPHCGVKPRFALPRTGHGVRSHQSRDRRSTSRYWHFAFPPSHGGKFRFVMDAVDAHSCTVASQWLTLLACPPGFPPQLPRIGRVKCGGEGPGNSRGAPSAVARLANSRCAPPFLASTNLSQRPPADGRA